MSKMYVAGDISKEKIDFCIYDGEKYLVTRQVKNTKQDLKKFVTEVGRFYKGVEDSKIYDECIFLFEYTGIYNNLILDVLDSKGYKVALIHPGALKAVVTVDRNKNDEYDSKKIAEYGFRFNDKLIYVTKDSNDLKELKTLVTERASLVKMKSQITQKKDDQEKFLPTSTYMWIKKNNESIISEINSGIQKIEKKIEDILESKNELKENYAILLSVPGIGPVSAAVLISCSDNFKKFKSAKQLGSYCGVVPFERSSGAYKGRRQVSMKANKSIKTLLHLGALSLTSSNNFFGIYYRRKVEEGKNKMCALNNLRNKIITTAFACVTNKEKYNPEYKFSFAA